MRCFQVCLLGIMSAAIAALLFGARPASAANQTGLFPNFPYFKCTQPPTPYSLSPLSTAVGNNTYCGKLEVRPLVGSSDYCATEADLRKVEIDVRPTCDIKNTIVKATVNGAPTAVSPAFFYPPAGTEGSTVLRLTQLNLGMDDDGAIICITLTSKTATAAATACTTLEQLCQPPPGASTPGTCSAALVDTTLRCCDVYQVSPIPPPPPSPPPPPPPPPPPRLTCAYIHPQPTPTFIFPLTIPPERCTILGNQMINDMLKQAAAVGAEMDPRVTPYFTCFDTVVRSCLAFRTPEDGSKLQNWVREAVVAWHDAARGGDAPDKCRPWLTGYQMMVEVGGYGLWPDVPPTGDLSASYAQAAPPDRVGEVCQLNMTNVDFPKCKCNKTVFATSFGVDPWIYAFPGRKNSTLLYCFTTLVVNASDPTSACGRTTSLFKAEIWADDKQRTKLKAIALQPAGAAQKTFISPSWGGVGEKTLKVSPLNWSRQQAAGGQICLELDKDTNIDSFCVYGSALTCWINFYDTTSSCCPLYSANVDP